MLRKCSKPHTGLILVCILLLLLPNRSYVEDHDLSEQEPEIFAAIAANFTVWYDSIHDSIQNESKCGGRKPGPSPGPPPGPFPKGANASSSCTFVDGKALNGSDIAMGSVASKEVLFRATHAVGMRLDALLGQTRKK